MIELKKCCKVPFPEKLFEKYEVKENAIYANVNTSKIIDVMKRFFDMLDGKAVMDKAPVTEGRNILMILSPAK